MDNSLSVDQATALCVAPFITLEEELLHTDFSLGLVNIDDFLHPELFEISPQGQYTARADIVAWLLAKPTQQRWILSQARLTQLDNDNMLLCYQANSLVDGETKKTGSLRSSIWRREQGRWRLFFHQATPY